MATLTDRILLIAVLIVLIAAVISLVVAANVIPGGASVTAESVGAAGSLLAAATGVALVVVGIVVLSSEQGPGVSNPDRESFIRQEQALQARRQRSVVALVLVALGAVLLLAVTINPRSAGEADTPSPAATAGASEGGG